MKDIDWMIYGAYGYTGRLIVEEAVDRGHRPLLAGRSHHDIMAVASTFGLDYLVLDLENVQRLQEVVSDFDLVFHAAGPFSKTAAPVVDACLKGSTNYLDITGESQVFEAIYARHEEAKRAGIVLLPGAGMDVVPTDCLASYVAQRTPGATHLELAIANVGGSYSGGTAQTMIEVLPAGFFVRRNGELVTVEIGDGARTVPFADRAREVVPAPLAELVTTYRHSGIPNITTYVAVPGSYLSHLRLPFRFLQTVLGVPAVRWALQRAISALVDGPDAGTRAHARTAVWAKASRPDGSATEAWLMAPETYRLTALAAVRCVEEVISQKPTGALTPAQAFGSDFVLTIAGVERLDHLPHPLSAR